MLDVDECHAESAFVQELRALQIRLFAVTFEPSEQKVIFCRDLAK